MSCVKPTVFTGGLAAADVCTTTSRVAGPVTSDDQTSSMECDTHDGSCAGCGLVSSARLLVDSERGSCMLTFAST